MGSCVSWLLLLSQAVILGIAVTGVWVSVNNFGDLEEPPPTPPPTTTTNITTTPKPHSYFRSDFGGNRRNPEFDNYVRKTRDYSLFLLEPRYILSVPCGAVGVTAFLTLVAGLCTRGIFATTTNLHSNLGQLILTFLCVFGYQSSLTWKQSYNGYEYRPNVGFWMISLQSGMVAVLLLQFVLNIWELRRRKSGWPTFNFTHLFTWEFLVLVGRLVLVCNVVGWYIASSLVFGLQENWYVPSLRYPLWLSVPAGVAAGFSAVAILENILSLIFGILHPQIVWMSAVLSSVGHVWIAVLASPVFNTAFLGTYNGLYHINFVLFITGIISGLCCFFHAVACWFGAKRLRTPPKVVLLAAESFKSLSLADLLKGTKSLTSSMEVPQNGAFALFKSANEKSTLTMNVVASSMSALGIITLSIGMASSWHPSIVGAMVLMMVDVCVFQRNVPNVIIYMYTKQVQNVKAPFAQRVIWHSVECVLVLVGAIATFTSGLILLLVTLMHFIIYAVKTMVLVQEHLDNTKAIPHQKLQEETEREGEEAHEPKCEKEKESDLYIPV